MSSLRIVLSIVVGGCGSRWPFVVVWPWPLAFEWPWLAGARVALVAWLASLLGSESPGSLGHRTGFNTPSQVIHRLSGIKLIEDEWTHELVVLCQLVFGEEISDVGAAGSPIDVKLFLVNAVADPIKSHINGFGALLLNSAIHDAGSGGVVGGNGGRRLGVAHLL